MIRHSYSESPVACQGGIPSAIRAVRGSTRYHQLALLFLDTLAQVPLGGVPFVLQGYESDAHLDNTAEARILWDKLCAAVERFEKGGVYDKSLDHLLAWISRIV
jgi:hypothetical protein